jgi:hypothetical protein
VTTWSSDNRIGSASDRRVLLVLGGSRQEAALERDDNQEFGNPLSHPGGAEAHAATDRSRQGPSPAFVRAAADDVADRRTCLALVAQLLPRRAFFPAVRDKRARRASETDVRSSLGALTEGPEAAGIKAVTTASRTRLPLQAWSTHERSITLTTLLTSDGGQGGLEL